MTQKSKSIDQKTNSMIYHGGLRVYGNTGLVETAGLKPPNLLFMKLALILKMLVFLYLLSISEMVIS